MIAIFRKNMAKLLHTGTNVWYTKNKHSFAYYRMRPKEGFAVSLWKNVRFIERDFWFQKMLNDTEALHSWQIDDLLGEANAQWDDLTFKFFDDGSVTIIDNDTDTRVSPRELKGAALDFYIRKRIEFIRSSLQEKILMYA